MGEGKTQMLQDQWFQFGGNMKNQDHHELSWMMINEDHHGDQSHSSSSSFGESSSTISNGSCSSSSLDTTDDASSSPTPCSPPSDGASLYDLSALMSQLPIKRGLSKFYQGKSQSFTCLSRVTSLEDLAKKETPYRRKMKACKSYGGGLDSYKSYNLPKPTILKKASSRTSSFSSSCPTRKKPSFISRNKPPLIPVQRT